MFVIWLNIQLVANVISFTDDKSWFVNTVFMKHKSEAFNEFNEYVIFAENVTGNCVKSQRWDNRGEYDSQKFIVFINHVVTTFSGHLSKT